MGSLFLEVLINAALLLYPTWRIFERVGLSPAASFLVLIPSGLGIVICSLTLIFSKWRLGVVQENS